MLCECGKIVQAQFCNANLHVQISVTSITSEAIYGTFVCFSVSERDGKMRVCAFGCVYTSMSVVFACLMTTVAP